MKTFIDVFSTSDETKSTKAKFCWEELARVRPDGIHQEFALQLEFALAVDLGVHLTRGTYLLAGDEMLVGNCSLSFRVPRFDPPVSQTFLFYSFLWKLSQCRPRELYFRDNGLFKQFPLFHLQPLSFSLFSNSYAPSFASATLSV